MKAFVIYIKHHVESELAAKECIESCEGRGFEAELFEGVTPNTLALWDNHYNLKPIPNRYEGQVNLNVRQPDPRCGLYGLLD